MKTCLELLRHIFCRKFLEEQNAYQYLDSAPQTLAAGNHRPAYATDGDYFSKPNADSIIEKIIQYNARS